MGNFNLLFAMNENPNDLKIRKYPSDDFGDSPDEHRWRAWWDNDGVDGTVRGIVLRCYPVTKVTPCGAWVDPDSWTQGGRNGIEWNKSHDFARWVSNDGGAAWAKRTQKEALDSIAVRHARWSQRIISDARYFIEATRALKMLLPERTNQADSAIRSLADFIAAECANDNLPVANAA
ncbi:hypothetical protein LB559_08995 [Mesorhizobium sp. BR1-1-3]|uniref:hypothetical protein n=1 Tax=Mesorhizobium sp. BR1-1-3 TaxID=2876651 RepID=UPI001CD0921F|nr:hypothetical protein [Mesorhizobium sp. BR1-1-3]MBZ9888074.1 hypothetical protein [Mesorhizobium sp. BR1-1-3]